MTTTPSRGEIVGSFDQEFAMTVTAPDRPKARPKERPAAVEKTPNAKRVVLYGDFNCPWSYLASRRAALLADHGVEVDWRAVEHDPARAGSAGQTQTPSRRVRLGRVLDEMQDVLGLLLPSEELPYALAGFVPGTSAAVVAYAAAYRTGVAGTVRRVLFEALWLHGFDLADPCVIHTLTVDAVRCDIAGSAVLSDWEYDGLTGRAAPDTQRLVDRWATEWVEDGNQTVPVLCLAGGERICGAAALSWLGAELLRRGALPGANGAARSLR